MDKITVKYKHGKFEFTGSGVVTAPMIDQVLTQAQPRLAEVLGDYQWCLEKRKHDYVVCAFYSLRGKRERFVEAAGKTPREAMQNWISGGIVLRDQFGINF